MDGFEFPQVWSFPPFFTLQPNEETKTKQTGMWIDIITRFQAVSKQNAFSPSSSIFTNSSIDSKL
jgi:ESCRT-II complex subunit VPS25